MTEEIFNNVVELNDKLTQLKGLQEALNTASLELRYPNGAVVKLSNTAYAKDMLAKFTESFQRKVNNDIYIIKQEIENL